MAKSVRLLKRQIRKEIEQALPTLSDSMIAEESNLCAKALFNLPQFVQSKNISIYLSMASGELQTESIVEKAFQLGKRVFVPFVDGKMMHMVETPSLADVKNFTQNRWGIPEPSSIDGRADALQEGLDLVVVPGVGFDRKMHRIGHGKGYYDCFFKRYHDEARQSNQPMPVLVALALKIQLLEEGRIPMTQSDRKMDCLIVNGELIQPDGNEPN